MKVSAFVAVTLDGFIARENGDLDWIPEFEDTSEDFGFHHFLESVDVLVMGRKTYEFVLSSHQWVYGKKKVVVMSHSLKTIDPALPPSVEITALPPDKLYQELKKSGMTHIYVDGGRTIRGFLNAGLLSELILTEIPVLIGDGIPLFGKIERDIRVRHIETISYKNGFVQKRYAVLQ